MTDAPEDSALRALRDVNEQLLLHAVQDLIDRERSDAAHRAAERAGERDALTDLPNRRLLFSRFAQVADLALRHQQRLAVLFVDLDDFKRINDARGHAHGDDVLRHAAASLLGVTRTADTVCRYGGDEFVVLLTDVNAPADARGTAVKLLGALAMPMPHGIPGMQLTASIGISIFPDDGTDLQRLIECADRAMYVAKHRGHGLVALYQPDAGAPDGQPTLAPPSTLAVAVGRADAGLAILREANERLVLAVLSAQALQADAEDARRAQSEFMAIVAHELRNPLAPMRNAAELLRSVIDPSVNLAKLQAIIERQVVHMARLVDDLLDVSRVQAAKFRLDVRRMDLIRTVEQAIEMCHAAMLLREQTFDSILPTSPVWMLGDPVRLAQVVGNLLDNASKYTPTGGTITLHVTARPDDVTISVSDTGIGITAESLPRIFDLFSQDPDATRFNSVDLGIGLTVVRELVLAHGGQVIARPGAGAVGTEFLVTLPRATAI